MRASTWRGKKPARARQAAKAIEFTDICEGGMHGGVGGAGRHGSCRTARLYNILSSKYSTKHLGSHARRGRYSTYSGVAWHTHTPAQPSQANK